MEQESASLQAVEGGQPLRAVSGSIPIALLSKGRYAARAVVTVAGRRVGQMTRPFRIVK